MLPGLQTVLTGYIVSPDGREFIAGLVIFSLLFACAIVPKASTISMMFFVVPEGITRIPVMALV